MLQRKNWKMLHWYVWFNCEKIFIALNADVEKLDIDKLVNFPTSLNILKRKVGDLDVDRLETVPVDF